MQVRIARVCALLLVALLAAGCGSGGGPSGSPAAQSLVRATSGACGSATAPTVTKLAGFVATHIYAGEHIGPKPRRIARQVRASTALASAVAVGDAAAARAVVLKFVFSHLHVVRMRITRAGGGPLVDIGAGNAFAPITGVLRLRGRTVGRFSLSIQDEHGYTLLIRHYLGAQVVIRAGRRVVGGSLPSAPAQIPAHGSFSFGGATYLTRSFTAQAFDGSPLRVYLLMHRPSASVEALTCADVIAGTLRRAAVRSYRETIIGPNAQLAVRYVENSPALRAAVASGSPATARAAVAHALSAGYFARLRVSRGPRVLADLGASSMVGPIPGLLREPNGRVVGRYVLALQSADGYVGLTHSLLGTEVLVRAGSRQLAGTLTPGPASLPERGVVTYGGVSYLAFSFAEEAFPAGSVRVSVLAPASLVG